MPISDAEMDRIAERAATKAVEKSTDKMLGLVKEKLDPVLEEMRFIREEHQKVSARQSALEETQASQEGKLRLITDLLRNEVIDRRLEWYDRNIQAMFALQNCVIVAPNPKVSPCPIFGKEDVTRVISSKLPALELGMITVSANGKKSYRVLVQGPDRAQNNRIAASILLLSKVFDSELQATVFKDTPQPLRPLRLVWSYLLAKLRQETSLAGARFNCYRGLVRLVHPSPGKAPDGSDLPGSEIPLFPEGLVHPDFDVCPFIDLIKTKFPEFSKYDAAGLDAGQLERGVLFREASNALLDSMAGPRRSGHVPFREFTRKQKGQGNFATMDTN